MLAQLYWRRYRCTDCGRSFTLPLDDVTLPAHPRDRAERQSCPAGDAMPA